MTVETAINYKLVNQVQAAIDFKYEFTANDKELQCTCNDLNRLIKERKIIARCIKLNTGQDQQHAIEDFKRYNDNINKLLGL